MAGKAALALEAGFSWPPPRGHWMRDHEVMSEILLSCNRLKLPRRTQTALQKLESWLPPGPHDPNPAANTEYVFDGGIRWSLPVYHYRASHAQTAFRALKKALILTKSTYKSELKGLSGNV